jgi:predicted Fe-S protein YdhL (DUF1289 family)
MWVLVELMFACYEDLQLFPMFGDCEVSGLSVTCTGNHRLLNDIHNWVQVDSQGVIKILENCDGYDTTYVYDNGDLLSEVSVSEEVEV